MCVGIGMVCIWLERRQYTAHNAEKLGLNVSCFSSNCVGKTRVRLYD